MGICLFYPHLHSTHTPSPTPSLHMMLCWDFLINILNLKYGRGVLSIEHLPLLAGQVDPVLWQWDQSQPRIPHLKWLPDVTWETKDFAAAKLSLHIKHMRMGLTGTFGSSANEDSDPAIRESLHHKLCRPGA